MLPSSFFKPTAEVHGSLAWYCQFLLSGRVVSTMPPTLSILQCKRPAAMNRDISLPATVTLDWIEQGLTSHQTHYRSYRGRVFTGQMTQPTVPKHWKKIGP